MQVIFRGIEEIEERQRAGRDREREREKGEGVKKIKSQARYSGQYVVVHTVLGNLRICRLADISKSM